VAGVPGHRRTLRLDLTYRGDAFHGWQRQPGLRTVQGVVEEILERLLGAPHTLVSCGRTDAGAHARQHVTSLRTTHAMPAEELATALDALLPDDVGVVDLCDVPASFHAQRDAVWKWYRYRVLLSRRRQPLVGARAWRRATAPALDRLTSATAPLLGRHDFSSFANSGSTPGRTMVRTMHALIWRAGEADGDDGLRDATRSASAVPWIALDVVGDGFLYKMVRTLVGTVFEAAGHTDPAARVREVLAARDRRRAGIAVPADGLTLMAVGVACADARAAPAAALPAGWAADGTGSVPGMPADLVSALRAADVAAGRCGPRPPHEGRTGHAGPQADIDPSAAVGPEPAPGSARGRRATRRSP
jgi:tRNA pseudouridine38-40 synthase